MLKHKKTTGEKKSTNTRKYKIKQICILLVLLIASITIVSTFGRYVVNSINNFYLRTKEFYFYSDKLTDTSAYYQIDKWTGVDPYTITVNMDSRLNNLKAATYDIGYNVTYRCSDNATCQFSKTSGTILATTNTDFFNCIITPNVGLNVGDKVWVEITASSTAQYKKTLKATFVLKVGRENLAYEITDEASKKYMDLNITNTLSYYTVQQAFDTYNVGDKIDVDRYVLLTQENKDKCYSSIITLTFDPNIVLLDMTNENYLNATNVTTTTIDGTNYINGLTFKVEPISSAVVRFYKRDVSQNYTYPIVNSTSIINVSTQ